LTTQRLPASDLAKAVDILEQGGVVAFPTDTVYGVGSFDLERLYDVKERPREKRIAYLVASPPADLPPAAMALAAALLPTRRSTAGDGPTKRIPAPATVSANSARSERKP